MAKQYFLKDNKQIKKDYAFTGLTLTETEATGEPLFYLDPSKYLLLSL